MNLFNFKKAFSRPTTALVTKTRSRFGDNDAGYFQASRDDMSMAS